MKAFPALQSFNFSFDHGKHVRQTNCATCHRPARQGVAFSIPSGAAAHATCFQCHTPEKEVAGRNIGSCSVCHQAGRPASITTAAKAFTENFSHQRHLSGGKMNCAACHTVRAVRSLGEQVSSPVAKVHSAPGGTQSCASCHNNKRAFGPGDFSNCKRCHQGNSFKF